MGNITFREVKDNDYEMIHKWCSKEFVYEWFEQRVLSYDEIVNKYESKLHNSNQEVRIIEYKGKPIGLIQYYPYDKSIDGLDKVMEYDLYIGEEEYLSKGIGKDIVRYMDDILVSIGADGIVLQPFKRNERACYCYEKCGFKNIDEYVGTDTIGNREEYILYLYKPIKLREVVIEDKDEILRLYKEYMDAPPIPGIDTFEGVRNFEHLEELSFEDWFKELDFNKDKNNLPPEFSTQTTYLVEADKKIVGMINVRWEKVPILMEFGGLIGYSIRPEARGKGYANEMLRLGLIKLRDSGVKDFIVSCKDFNVASKKVIERNGGVFERGYDADDGYHYLIYHFD